MGILKPHHRKNLHMKTILMIFVTDVAVSFSPSGPYESHYPGIKCNVIFVGFNFHEETWPDTSDFQRYFSSVSIIPRIDIILNTKFLMNSNAESTFLYVRIPDNHSYLDLLDQVNSKLLSTKNSHVIVLLFPKEVKSNSIETYLEANASISAVSLALFCFISENTGPLVDPAQLTISILMPNVIGPVECFEAFSLKEKLIWQSAVNFGLFEIYSLLSYIEISLTFKRRHNFNGILVPAATQITPLEVSVVIVNNKTEFSGGIQVEEYMYLRDALNFSTKAVISNLLLEVRNGALVNSGLAKLLNTGEADLCITPHEFVTSRASGPYRIQYLHPSFSLRWDKNHPVVAFVQPSISSFRNVYRNPFEHHVWLALFAMFVIQVATLALGIYLAKRCSLLYNYCVNSDILMWVITVGTQRSLYRTPQFIFLRITCLTAFLTSSVMYTVYSSNLISILFRVHPPIQTLQDLVHAGYAMHFNLYSPSMIPIITTLQDSTNDTNEQPISCSLQDAIPLITKSRIAFFTASDAFYYLYLDGYSTEDLCKTVSVMPASQRVEVSAMFVKHGSEFREYFNRVLIQIQERGVKNRLMRHFQSKATLSCPEEYPVQVSEIKLDDMYSAFLILFSVMVICIVILLMENWFKQKCIN